MSPAGFLFPLKVDHIVRRPRQGLLGLLGTERQGTRARLWTPAATNLGGFEVFLHAVKIRFLGGDQKKLPFYLFTNRHGFSVISTVANVVYHPANLCQDDVNQRFH